VHCYFHFIINRYLRANRVSSPAGAPYWECEGQYIAPPEVGFGACQKLRKELGAVQSSMREILIIITQHIRTSLWDA
jgi:hypothetical protein